MNWAWASSLDHIWRSPSFPMWLTLAAAGFFAILMLITLIRAEKSVANGALTVITLLAVGVAVAATIRGFGWPPGSRTSSAGQPPPAMAAGQAGPGPAAAHGPVAHLRLRAAGGPSREPPRIAWKGRTASGSSHPKVPPPRRPSRTVRHGTRSAHLSSGQVNEDKGAARWQGSLLGRTVTRARL